MCTVIANGSANNPLVSYCMIWPSCLQTMNSSAVYDVHPGRGLQHHVVCAHPKQRQESQQAGPDISLLSPALQKQWDHDANARLGTIVIKPYSKKKVTWKCDACPDGYLHQWTAVVQSRSKGNGCPYCSGRQVCKHNCLATKAPWAAAQWDYEANAALGTPDTVVSQSHQPAGWHCQVCHHRWTASLNNRVSKQSGCPQCAPKGTVTKHPTFAECRHPLLAEWDHKRNEACGNYPHNTTLRSRKQIFWLCNRCPAGQEHSWSATPNARTWRCKTGCPLCAGHVACRCNSLPSLVPAIAAQWDYGRNKGQPSDYTAQSHHLAWWNTPERGSWQQSINLRTMSAAKAAKQVRGQQQ